MDSERVSVQTAHADFSQSVEDDPLMDGPLISRDCLESAIRKDFRKLPTAWVASLLSVVHVVYVTCSVILAVLCWLTDTRSAECRAVLSGVDSRTLVLLGKVAVWLLFLGFERCVQRHHGLARRNGYLRFYRRTRGITRLPLLVHSAGNAVVLVVVATATALDAKVINLSIHLLLAIICIELLASIVCLLVYSAHVVRFNSQRLGPDVSEDEQSNVFSANSCTAQTETGFRDGSSLDEVVEKQADLIEYLKQHNMLLSKRILELGSQPIRA